MLPQAIQTDDPDSSLPLTFCHYSFAIVVCREAGHVHGGVCLPHAGVPVPARAHL